MTRTDPAPAILDDLRRRIGDEEVSFTFARSGGPGGQNVNKVNTRATLWFNLAESPSLSAGEKSIIRRKLATRLGHDGQFHVTMSRFRTQAANRAAAIERFFELLAAALTLKPVRKPTKVPRGARVRRLESKRAQSLRKRERRSRSADAPEM